MLTVLMVFGLLHEGYAQAVAACSTMEQQQAKYNQDKANAVTVRDTPSQQLQCYYQQLATYWQQKDKDNQQIAKDAQQKAKDAQQIAKDAQQWDADKQLSERTAALNCAHNSYDELKCFIEVVIPRLDLCGSGEKVEDIKKELKRIHTNRSGGGDGTNPGGHGNLNGFDNPGYLISRQ